jgi:hypothetical protein
MAPSLSPFNKPRGFYARYGVEHMILPFPCPTALIGHIGEYIESMTDMYGL